jgi:protease-4
MLASACQFVFLQPSGTVGLMGLRAEVAFFKQLLSRWKVSAEFSGREQYKSAMNTFTESGQPKP